jgi:hypothetical protein
MKKKKEIKIKIDKEILENAKEYDIDIEELLSIAIMRQVNEIRETIMIKEFIRKLDENAIINIINKIINKNTKLNCALKSQIIADAKELSISKERTIDILNKLEDNKIIYQSSKNNYQISKKPF